MSHPKATEGISGYVLGALLSLSVVVVVLLVNYEAFFEFVPLRRPVFLLVKWVVILVFGFITIFNLAVIDRIKTR